MNKIYLFLLTLFAAVGIANAVDTVIIWGDAVGSNTGYEMQTNDNGVTYTYDITVDGTTTKWMKFKIGNHPNNEYGAVDGSNYTYGSLISLTNGSFGDVKFTDLPSAGIYTVVLNNTNKNVTLRTADESGGDNPGGDKGIPSKIYVIGNGYGYDNNGTPQEMTPAGNNTFKLTVDFPNAINYFRFTTSSTTDTATADWHFGPSSNTDAVKGEGNSNAVKRGNTTANYMIANGKYDIVLKFTDADNATFTIVDNNGEGPDDPVVGVPSELWLISTVNGYDIGEPIRMTWSESEQCFKITEVKLDKNGINSNDFFRFITSKDGKDNAKMNYGPTGSGNQGAKIGVENQLKYENNTGNFFIAPGVYDITVSFKDAKNPVFTIKNSVDLKENLTYDQTNRQYLYLTGDINVWSDVCKRNAEHSKEGYNGNLFGVTGYEDYFAQENVGNSYFSYNQDDPNNPYMKFESIKDMNTKWRFDKISVSELPDAMPAQYKNDAALNDHWYKLDLKAKGAGDRAGHIGRLCGQFKVIRGDLWADDNKSKIKYDSEKYGVRGGDNDVYYNNLVPANEFYEGGAPSYDGAGANYRLYNTVVENAVIYFNSCWGQLYITGEPKDMYVYYAEVDNENPTKPTGTDLVELKQANNFVPVSKFEEGQLTYGWQEYTDAMAKGPIYYKGDKETGLSFKKVWRKKIPSGVIHHAPMSYLVSVTKKNGSWFPMVRFSCDDVWFVEGHVNIFFRYLDNDMNENADVRYNAFVDRYNATTLIKEDLPYFMFKDQYGETVKEEVKDGVHDGLWHKSKQEVSEMFSFGAYASVVTSYGDVVPLNHTNASPDEKAKVAINGTNVYIELGGTDPLLNILYSHENGTYSINDKSSLINGCIQVNAEYFRTAPEKSYDNHLDFGKDHLEYQFKIIGLGEQKDYTAGQDDYDVLPYYNWNVSSASEGLYRVEVKVRNVETKQVLATTIDTYVIFGADAHK